ncbi:hypothetical protein [Kitasatospora sp. NPDC018619]|uniref:hypothetical protein n=1 Tax=unclassified Kitasatospora TaxID=2633591 RepID=UPI0037B7B290
MSDVRGTRDMSAEGPERPEGSRGASAGSPRGVSGGEDESALARIALGLDGVRAAQHGRTAEARAGFEALWEALGERDVFHRCVVAHYLADLQDDPRAELEWDRRALAAADSLDADRARTYESALQVRAFYPSLHLNLASDLLKLGEPALAREQLEQAVRSLDALPEDAHTAGIRAAVDELRQRLR